MAEHAYQPTDQLKLIVARWIDTDAPSPPETKPARYRCHREALYIEPPSWTLKRTAAQDLIDACRAAARLPMVAEGSRGRRRSMPKTAWMIFAALVNITERYGRCCPSITYLAQKGDCTHRTVYRTLKLLERRGWIRRVARRKPIRQGMSEIGLQDTNGYEVHHPMAALGPVLAAPQTRVTFCQGKL